jgi:KUP system potassium uptake protein
VTVLNEEVPQVSDADRVEVIDLGKGFYRLLVRYGFMEQPDIPRALALSASKGLTFDMMRTTFFVSRESIVPRLPPGMAHWRELLFKWMQRNAVSAVDFFHIPTERVVELGTQVEI